MFDDIIVYDTETAGLTLEEGLVEHAWVEIDDHLNVLKEDHSLIKPPGPISHSASGVHGLTLEDVQHAPTVEEFWDSRNNAFANRRVLMIAHNAAFDQKYLAPFVGELDTLCTLKLARIAFPADTDGQEAGYVPPENHKLPTLMFYLGLQKKGTHNALDDVYTCLQLLKAISEKLGMGLDELYELSKQPVLIKAMPFGKHKGLPLADVPRHYVKWLLDQDNVDENLRWSFQQLT